HLSLAPRYLHSFPTRRSSDLFRERGFAGTTMESIAAEAGYAPQTVYFHFGTKAAILKHLVEESKSERVIPLYQRSLAAEDPREQDRKSTRLNSSHEWISYAVF